MPQTIRGVMQEFKRGELHSGSSSGPVVKKRSQAVAIALSEQRQKKGGHPHKNLGKFLHKRKG